MTGTEKMREIRSRHPFPWRDEVHPKGAVKIFDANNVEVGIFDIVAMCVIASTAMNVSQERKSA